MEPVTTAPTAPTVPATEEPLPLPSPEELGRPEIHLTPTQWIRQRLFPSFGAGLLTVVLGAVLAYLGYRFLWFLAVSSDWTIIRRELRSFMIGPDFPEDDAWRLWLALYVSAGLLGLFSGATAAQAEAHAVAAGRTVDRPKIWDWLRRYWPALAAVAGILSLTRTWLPTLLTVAGLVVLVGSRLLGRRVPALARYTGWAALAALVSVLQLLSGAWGPGWTSWAVVAGAGLAALAVTLVVTTRVPPRTPTSVEPGQIAPPGTGPILHPEGSPLLALLQRASLLVVLVGLVQVVLHLASGRGGVGWGDWGGFHLTVFVTIMGIALSFPFGVLVALGRRSSLPVVRWISLTYIELIRGVPLVTLLFMGRFVVPLLYPTAVDPPSHLVRALIVITLFEAAYVAETVRGGLQSIPRGQYEAAQAIGLPPTKVTRLIVLPQALRAVIPAMVGQFISLFKDTTLLSFIAFVELLEVGKIAAADTESLLNRWHTVIYVFVALIYWAGSYTMSRESRRLERRLGIGERR